MTGISEKDLNQLHALTLQMAKIFVRFCVRIISHVICAEADVLAQSDIKDGFPGMMTLIFLCPEMIMKKRLYCGKNR